MPDPKLVRDSAGSYHSADDRFAVTKEGTAWWLRDGALLDELGMPRVRGPFGTLDEVKAAIAGAEEAPATRRYPRSRGRDARK